MIDWPALSEEERNHLLGGRRRHNYQRQLAAAERRRKVLPMLVAGRLTQSEIARVVHVHKSTVCRDRRFLGRLVDLVRKGPPMPGGVVHIRIEPRRLDHEFTYG